MGGNATSEEAGARPPHDHTTYLSLAASTFMLAASMLVVGRADRVGCVLCGREGGEGESMLMMRRRTSDDEKAWLAGRSKASQSNQHRGKVAQWGRTQE